MLSDLFAIVFNKSTIISKRSAISITKMTFDEYIYKKSLRVIIPRTLFVSSTTTKCLKPKARNMSNIFGTDAFCLVSIEKCMR